VPYYGPSDGHNQAYVVPVSLGAIPGPTTANDPPGTVIPHCAIDPFEGDNLLDATQRHQSMDWDTVVQAPLAPDVLHPVDTATHSAPNTARASSSSAVGCLSNSYKRIIQVIITAPTTSNTARMQASVSSARTLYRTKPIGHAAGRQLP
jgi:hypothetical protein